jgi:hypothetical protein
VTAVRLGRSLMARLGSAGLALAACAPRSLPRADSGAAQDLAQGGIDGMTADLPPTCWATAQGGLPFGDPVPLSDGQSAAFTPTVAARPGRALIAWHEAFGGGSRILYSVIVDGCVETPTLLVDSASNPKLPAAVATASGFALAYQADEGGAPSARLVRLSPDGAIVGGPELVSGAGQPAWFPRAAADGDDIAVAWTDGGAHHFARRGPVETVAATPVGTALLSKVLPNYPRIAIGAAGRLYVVYRDGGTEAKDWDVLVVDRPLGGVFSAPRNLSQSPGLLSDDPAIAASPDGGVDVAWIEQDPGVVTAFEATYAHVTSSALGAPMRWASQGNMAWTPAIAAAVPGAASPPVPIAAWNLGASGVGEIYFADGLGAPVHLFPALTGSAVAIARGGSAEVHLGFTALTDGSTPKRVWYARH